MSPAQYEHGRVFVCVSTTCLYDKVAIENGGLGPMTSVSWQSSKRRLKYTMPDRVLGRDMAAGRRALRETDQEHEI